MWKPADVMATMMIGTICVVIIGVYARAWIAGDTLDIDRLRIIENLFVGMFGLVAYRMGKGDQ